VSKFEDIASSSSSSSREKKPFTNYSKDLRLIPDGPAVYTPSAPLGRGDETKKNCSRIKLTPYSTAGLNGTTSKTLGITDKTVMSTIRSKHAIDCGKIKFNEYGIDLPADHKDYWKHKKLYDAIANDYNY